MWRAVIVGLLSVAPLSSAFAWGDEGHRIVCGIAYKEATDQTRARIDALIATDGTFTSFADSCTWPDHPRQRAEEHYVDLLRYSGSLPDDTCPLADRCVVSAPPSRCSAILEDDDDPLNAAASWLRLRFSLPAARARLVAEVAGLGGAHG